MTLIAIVALGSNVVDQGTATMRMIGIGLPNRERLLRVADVQLGTCAEVIRRLGNAKRSSLTAP